LSYHDVLNLVEVLGVLAFAMTGIFEARRLKMDFIGVSSVAMITAFGGGTLRDLFLGRHPLFWIENWPFAAAILALSLVSVLVLKQVRSRKTVPCCSSSRSSTPWDSASSACWGW
jgi:uncharacterized membrane protein YeiH